MFNARPHSQETLRKSMATNRSTPSPRREQPAEEVIVPASSTLRTVHADQGEASSPTMWLVCSIDEFLDEQEQRQECDTQDEETTQAGTTYHQEEHTSKKEHVHASQPPSPDIELSCGASSPGITEWLEMLDLSGQLDQPTTDDGHSITTTQDDPHPPSTDSLQDTFLPPSLVTARTQQTSPQISNQQAVKQAPAASKAAPASQPRSQAQRDPFYLPMRAPPSVPRTPTETSHGLQRSSVPPESPTPAQRNSGGQRSGPGARTTPNARTSVQASQTGFVSRLPSASFVPGPSSVSGQSPVPAIQAAHESEIPTLPFTRGRYYANLNATREAEDQPDAETTDTCCLPCPPFRSSGPRQYTPSSPSSLAVPTARNGAPLRKQRQGSASATAHRTPAVAMTEQRGRTIERPKHSSGTTRRWISTSRCSSCDHPAGAAHFETSWERDRREQRLRGVKAETIGACSICKKSEMVSPTLLPCGHLFCQVCLKEWLRKKKTCPTCHKPCFWSLAEEIEPLFRDPRDEITDELSGRRGVPDTAFPGPDTRPPDARQTQLDARLRPIKQKLENWRSTVRATQHLMNAAIAARSSFQPGPSSTAWNKTIQRYARQIVRTEQAIEEATRESKVLTNMRSGALLQPWQLPLSRQLEALIDSSNMEERRDAEIETTKQRLNDLRFSISRRQSIMEQDVVLRDSFRHDTPERQAIEQTIQRHVAQLAAANDVIAELERALKEKLSPADWQDYQASNARRRW